MDRPPEGYMLLPADIAWLDECGKFLSGEPTKRSVTDATKAALETNPRGHAYHGVCRDCVRSGDSE